RGGAEAVAGGPEAARDHCAREGAAAAHRPAPPGDGRAAAEAVRSARRQGAREATAREGGAGAPGREADRLQAGGTDGAGGRAGGGAVAGGRSLPRARVRRFLRGAEQAERSLRAVETLQARLGMEEQLAQRYPGFVREPEAVKRGMKGVQGAAPPLREVVSELEQTMPRGEPLTPQQMEEMLRQQAEQKKIGDDLQQAREQLGQVGKKVPIFGPQHEQMLQQAQEGMGRPEQRLGQGEPRGAQAGEEQALEQLPTCEDAMP